MPIWLVLIYSCDAVETWWPNGRSFRMEFLFIVIELSDLMFTKSGNFLNLCLST